MAPKQCVATYAKADLYSIFAGHTTEQKDILHKSINQEDFVPAYEYTVSELNANQRRMALQLVRKHNNLGHLSRNALRCVLQQSHCKSERELARHVDLMLVCNHCLFGKNKKGARHKLKSATPAKPIEFLQHIAVDLGGKQIIKSMDGFWYPMYIICQTNSMTWVRFLTSPTEGKTKFEEWLREVPKQHVTHAVKAVRHDAGRADFGNKAFKKILTKYGITDEVTSGASTGNAKVERRIGVGTTDSLTNMAWCQGPRNWWTFSIDYGVTTRNLIPTSTNPGHMSPYECAYQRKPNYSMLVPFGCLAFAVMDNKDMGGKLNYRKASRVCAMIGYTLKPDGHPLGYRLYDCDLGTIIRRTDNLVTFNVDMPALKFIAERSAKRPIDLYNNAIIAKFFDRKMQNNQTKKILHWGKVVSHRYDTDGELLFRISYEDGDSEELNVTEMIVHTRLAAKHEREDKNFTVSHAPKSRSRKKLSQMLNSAPSTSKMTSSSNLQPDSSKTKKLSSTIGGTKSQQPTRRSSRRSIKPLRLQANAVKVDVSAPEDDTDISSILRKAAKCKGKRVSWADVLTKRIPNAKTTTSLPLNSPVRIDEAVKSILIAQAKRDEMDAATDFRAFTSTVKMGGPMFNIYDENARKRQLLRQDWAFTIACGAMVEPPPSNIPTIEVTPETLASSIPLPKSYWEAVTGPYRKYWIEGIRQELENLLSRKVWREEPLPNGSKPVPGKYVWKVKKTDKGTIAKWKVRYIIQGFRQRKGIDYDKTFASVANIVTIRVLLAMACELDWEVHQMDVKAAYLCSKIEENVRMYIRCPDGYKLDPGKAARLLMGLYGTKQGGALWGALRTRTLKKLKCKQSLADPSLYTRYDENGWVIVSCIVDDFVITGDPKAVKIFKSQVAKEWEMTDEGILFWCLNLKVTRDMKNGLLKIDQEQYVDEILRRFNMEQCNPRKTPMDEKPVLHLDMDPVPEKSEDYKENFPYASAMGSLLYLRLTRPDCLVTISILAKFMKNPSKSHWQAVKAVMRYVKGTKKRGLLFYRTMKERTALWTLRMWVDSDYATDVDTRRSRAGFLIYLNKNLIAFNSALQRGTDLMKKFPGLKLPVTAMDDEPMPSMATATCGAEYMALSLAVKELVWIYMLLKTIGIKIQKPIVVYEDNRATIKVAENACAMKRSKHIDIRHHFLREHIDNGLIKLVPVATAEQRADIMTKVLGRELFERFRNQITSDIDLQKGS